MASKPVRLPPVEKTEPPAEVKAVADLLGEIESWRERLKSDARKSRIMLARPWWSPRAWGAYAHWSWAMTSDQHRRFSKSLDPTRYCPGETVAVVRGPFGMEPALRRCVCDRYIAALR